MLLTRAGAEGPHVRAAAALPKDGHVEEEIVAGRCEEDGVDDAQPQIGTSDSRECSARAGGHQDATVHAAGRVPRGVEVRVPPVRVRIIGHDAGGIDE